MQIPTFENWSFPDELHRYMAEEGFWECNHFDPILITVQEVEYKGQSMISYEASLDIVEDFGDQDGYDVEKIILTHIRQIDEGFHSRINSDTEGETCVLWCSSSTDFYLLLSYMLEALRKEFQK